MRRSPGMVLLLTGFALIVWGPLAHCQAPPPKKPAAESQNRDRNDGKQIAPGNAKPAAAAAQRDTQEASLVMTPGREAAALKFAQLHHPELERLLARLEQNNPAEYRRAIRKLYQDSERLARTAERSPDRYDLELDAWKLDSRIRLLVARMTMSSDTDALDSQLQSLLQQRIELRLRQLRHERDRVATRLSRLDETITEIESDPEEAALKDLQRVKRSLGIPAGRANRAPSGRAREVSADAPAADADSSLNSRSRTTESKRNRRGDVNETD